MLPLFKSDFSIGKSILTLEESSSRSIFALAQEASLDKMVLVEDSLTGFLKAYKDAEKLGIQLVFGLRLSMCSDMTQEIPKGGDPSEHKVVVFATDGDGCRLLNKIYSAAFTKGNGRIDSPVLKKLWDEGHLKLAVPFYDSFLFNNLMRFKSCVMDFSFCPPTFFIEDNELPFDALVLQKVKEYVSKNNYPLQKVQTIYYKTAADFPAYQTYKCICKRASYGRGASLGKPNLDHCGSSSFSFERWQEKTRPLKERVSHENT
jgi:DNA polymerase III alpha subunit